MAAVLDAGAFVAAAGVFSFLAFRLLMLGVEAEAYRLFAPRPEAPRSRAVMRHASSGAVRFGCDSRCRHAALQLRPGDGLPQAISPRVRRPVVGS